MNKMFSDSINLAALLASIPVLTIQAVISGLKASNPLIRGPVDHNILCHAEAEYEIRILQ